MIILCAVGGSSHLFILQLELLAKTPLLQSYTIIAVLSLDGIIHLDVIPGAANGALFNIFVENLLEVMNPWPQNNSVLAMDNASIHKTAGLRDLIEARQVFSFFLFGS